MNTATNLAISWVEKGLTPDTMTRAGIRRLLRDRLAEIHADDPGKAAELAQAFIADLRASAVALLPEKANEQHYEVPAEFFAYVLGPRRKYSSCWWPDGVSTLADAEEAALEATCNHAGIRDGQHILELGCGWGSLTLWMAEHYPASRITALSNSRSQRAFIENELERRGLKNVQVITCDINDFDATGRYDRIVSVEMFEHLRNWQEAFRRVRGWLKPDGRFLMHVFVHRTTPYAFVARDASDWMSRYFFSGGMMPSDDLALRLQDDLRVIRLWRWDGTHYQRTANAWLDGMDGRRPLIEPVLAKAYGADQVDVWWTRWRIFFMSCAELFGYEHGRQWWVSHYLFEPRV